jgi:hypothetical protein
MSEVPLYQTPAVFGLLGSRADPLHTVLHTVIWKKTEKTVP